ncbi:MAG TPA: helix-hairpin-helix domain-containing protein [Bacteroidales bacterium]|nr:helix-hairpin-helix domain-containing protein [Bacteroidales bacterium]
MVHLIKKLFYLHRSERRALLVVVVILLFSVGFRFIALHNSHKDNSRSALPGDFVALMKGLSAEMERVDSRRRVGENMFNKTANKRSFSSDSYSDDKKWGLEQLKPMRFDPNTITEDSLRLMHLSEYFIRSFINYRDAGARFRKPDDLKRVYGMNTDVYELLEPYIYIAPPINERTEKKFYKPNYSETPVLPMIELNRSDSIELQLIRGIGTSYARRIVKYRNLLGGFYSFAQLMEVYGMDSVRFRAIKERCEIDTLLLEKFDINHASFREIISHPYFGREETLALLQYRDFADSIGSMSDLVAAQIIDLKLLHKIRPYIRFDSEINE